MRKSHLWAENEIQEVGYKYQDNLLLQSLRPIALKISPLTQVSLSPEVLFYHTLFSLDDLKGNQSFKCDTLWDELNDYLSQRCDAEKDDIENMASSVALTVAYVLSVLDPLKYYSEITALIYSLKGTKAVEMSQRLRVLENEDKNQDLKQWLSEYMNKDSYLSEEIEDLVNRIREQRVEEEQKQKLLENSNIGYLYLNSEHNDNHTETNIYASHQLEEK